VRCFCISCPSVAAVVAPRVEVELSSVLRSGRHLWARQDVGGRDRVYSLELCVRGLFVLVFGDLS
jgi:hypothetical protein